MALERRQGRVRRRLTGAGVLVLIVAVSGLAQLPRAEAKTRSSRVIVRYGDGAKHAAERAVTNAHGSVRADLDALDELIADVPAAAAAALGNAPGVTAVMPDGKVTLLSSGASAGGAYDPTASAGSLYSVTTMTGARAWWSAGFTGKGVDVALIDSGVAPVAGLTGKVVQGPDFSFDAPSPAYAHNDSYGHGTHMASIIAGRDSGATRYATNTSSFLGMAPDARILNVKVADTTGQVDISQVIAAIDWVIEHRNSDGNNVRVLNLSFGTDSQQSYLVDPLTYAAEVAWRKGIVVIASAGNGGYAKGRAAPGLTDPAVDPFVVAVGAADSEGTVSMTDDQVAGFSSSGSGGFLSRGPDLVAPGRSIEGLKSPGSFADVSFPKATVGGRFMRGSGSSQAAAVVSGAAALVLSRYPNATPDQVKALLRASALPLAAADPSWQGRGELDLRTALGAGLPSPTAARQVFWAGSGMGTIEGSRGSVHAILGSTVVTGERDIFGNRFTGFVWADRSKREIAWDASGTSWDGARWLAGPGTVLSGLPAGISATGTILLQNRWSANRWSATGWSGNRWSGNRWSDALWSSDSWS